MQTDTHIHTPIHMYIIHIPSITMLWPARIQACVWIFYGITLFVSEHEKTILEWFANVGWWEPGLASCTIYLLCGLQLHHTKIWFLIKMSFWTSFSFNIIFNLDCALSLFYFENGVSLLGSHKAVPLFFFLLFDSPVRLVISIRIYWIGEFLHVFFP